MDEGNRRPAERVRRSPAAPGKRRRAVPQSHHTAVEEPSPIFCCAMDGSGICMLGTDRRPAPVGLARAAAVRSDRQEGCPLTLALPAPQGEGTIQVPQRLVIPNCGDDWTSTPPHPSPLPASGAREQFKCGSALLPPRPMQWGEGWGEGNRTVNSATWYKADCVVHALSRCVRPPPPGWRETVQRQMRSLHQWLFDFHGRVLFLLAAIAGCLKLAAHARCSRGESLWMAGDVHCRNDRLFPLFLLCPGHAGSSGTCGRFRRRCRGMGEP